MSTINKEEDEIINADFKKALDNELLIIKRLITDFKKRKGLYKDVISHGANLYNSKNCIIEKTGLSDKLSGALATTLWFLAKPEIDRVRQLKMGVTEAIWVYEDFLCKHQVHASLNGKKYPIGKGMKIGLFKRIYAGQLVGCNCMAKAVMPSLDKNPT